MSDAQHGETQRREAALRAMNVVVVQLRETLIERDAEIALAMLAMVSRQHLFLLGPPGTAKSYLASQVGMAAGATFFERLLTRFTDPAEVFGPLNVKRFMEETVWEREVAGYMPTAQVVFLDEAFKASSAILNSLLTIVNERKFDNGTGRIDVPLQTLFGASNELPQDESLGALYDRFLIRAEVLPVKSPEGQAKLLEPRPKVTARLKDLRVLQDACATMPLGSGAVTGMIQIRDSLWREGVPIGDRRFQQSASLVRGAAVLDSAAVAESKHLWPLQYAFWQTPDQIETVKRIVVQHLVAVPPVAPTKPLPGNFGGAKPPPPRPPAQPPSGGSFGTFVDIAAHVMRSSSTDNATNRALHQGIEFLLQSNTVSGREKVQLEQWKSAIRTTSGGNWLA